ncbi:MAG: hypothetical protein QME73_12640 [Bacillota bacterium]|nr:hypothetical protein [Bacillota bacterium]
MKIGIVAPSDFIKKINMVVENEFDYMEYTNIIYTEYAEIAGKLEHRQKGFDAMLFAGQTLYNYARKQIKPAVLWDFIPRHGSSLLKTLLKASRSGYDISNVSFDSYKSGILYETYNEIGIDSENLNICIAPEKPFEYDYFDNIYAFHKKNYTEGKASCCITALLYVYERLHADKIPCVFIEPTINIIRETLSRLHLKHIAQVNQNSQIVVLSIAVNTPDEYSLLNHNEYQLALDRMKISEQIYLFAQKLQAAVLEVNSNNYFLFSTRNILEVETDNFQKIDLFNRINNEALSSISMGIGYGETVREAKYNANLGMLKAKKWGRNAVYVVYERKRIIGPIEYEGKKGLQQSKIDEKILNVAEKSEISVNTIFKLYSIVNRYKQDCFTSKELAKIYGISVRSMNRILNKLEAAGFAKVVGKKVVADAGRPSRIIKIFFE